MPLRTRALAGGVALLVAALVLASPQRPLAAEFPRPSGYVNDLASVLTEDDRVYLENVPPVLVVVPFFSVFVALGGFAAGLGLRTRTIAPLVAGGLFTAIPLFIAAMMSPLSLAVLVPLELVVLALGYRKGRLAHWVRALRAGSSRDGRATDPDVWILGGTSDSSSGGASHESSSSSDFGGGSSGGGGASGRW